MHSLFRLLIFLTSLSLLANDSITRVYQFDIMEQIAPSVWRKTKKAFAEADSFKAD
jgi:hypothetical protein